MLTEPLTALVLENILREEPQARVDSAMMNALKESFDSHGARVALEVILAYRLKLILQDSGLLQQLMQRVRYQSVMKTAASQAKRSARGQQPAAALTLPVTSVNMASGSNLVRFVNCRVLKITVQRARQVYSRWGGRDELFIFYPMQSERADAVVCGQALGSARLPIPLICRFKLHPDRLSMRSARTALDSTAPELLGLQSPSVRVLLAYNGFSSARRDAETELLKSRAAGRTDDGFLILDRLTAFPLIQAQHTQEIDDYLLRHGAAVRAQQAEEEEEEREEQRQGRHDDDEEEDEEQHGQDEERMLRGRKRKRRMQRNTEGGQGSRQRWRQ